MNVPITVRPVRRDDLEPLSLLDTAAYARHGIPSMSLAELAAWYEEESPLFLVAEHENRLCGYYYGRLIRFDVDEDAEAFCAPRPEGTWQWDRYPHNPVAESAYGICVAATVPGAGAALNAGIHDVLEHRRVRYYVGISRLSRLDRYVESIKSLGGELPDEGEIALWYTYQSADLLHMPIWPACPRRPCVLLPELRRPDPVLAFHVQGTTFGLLGLLPDYMPDAASRNFGAVIVSEFPHRRP